MVTPQFREMVLVSVLCVCVCVSHSPCQAIGIYMAPQGVSIMLYFTRWLSSKLAVTVTPAYFWKAVGTVPQKFLQRGDSQIPFGC